MSVTRLLSILVITLVGVGCVQPEWLAALGLDAEPGVSAEECRALEKRSQELDHTSQFTLRRLDLKRQVTRQFLAGELNLLEAAIAFHNIKEMYPVSNASTIPSYPGKSEGERLCRQVISWAQSELMQLPHSQVEAMAEGWEDELQDLLCRGGGVIQFTEE